MNIAMSGEDLWMGHRRCVPIHPLPYLFPEKKMRTSKKWKNNINQIYQIKLRLKGMTCLMLIAEAKNTFSAFKFFP